MNDLFTDEEPVTQLQTVPANVAEFDSMLAACVKDPAFDVDKLRAMLEMKREIDAAGAEQAYAEAMRDAQEEMRPVVRERQNSHTKAKYATLEQIHEACKPIWLKHGFSLSTHSDISPMASHYRVVTICRHTGGHKTEHFLDAPPDDAGTKGEKNKTPIQALGSTVSYVRRYLDLMIFDITLIGEDRDGNRSRDTTPVSDEQCLTMQAFIDEHELDARGFLKYMQVERLGDIPASEFNGCMNALRNKAREKSNANR